LSTGDEIKPASAVNPFGKIIGDPTIFKQVSSNSPVRVEKADL